MAGEGSRVLLTGDSNYGLLAAVRALAAAGYDPWVSESGDATYATRSRVVGGTVPAPSTSEEPDAAVRALAEGAKRIGARAVLPTTDDALVALAGREAEFGEVVVASPPPDVVERAMDKSLLAAIGAAAGTPAPPTVEVTRDSPDAELAAIAFPAVAKPERSKTVTEAGTIEHASARRVASVEELRAAVAALPGGAALVQPYVDGDLYAVGGVAWEGRMLSAVHQVSARIWPPECGGSAFATTVAPVAEVDRALGHLIGEIGWSGIFQAQFMRTADTFFLIDFNPRVYGTLGLAVAAGANLPAQWVDLLLGRAPAKVAYSAGVHFRAEDKDVRAIALRLVKGDVRGAARALLPRRRTTHAVFSAADPLPVLVTARKLLR